MCTSPFYPRQGVSIRTPEPRPTPLPQNQEVHGREVVLLDIKRVSYCRPKVLLVSSSTIWLILDPGFERHSEDGARQGVSFQCCGRVSLLFICLRWRKLRLSVRTCPYSTQCCGGECCGGEFSVLWRGVSLPFICLKWKTLRLSVRTCPYSTHNRRYKRLSVVSTTGLPILSYPSPTPVLSVDIKVVKPPILPSVNTSGRTRCV